MIQKDIVYNAKSNKINNDLTFDKDVDSVDSIFANADRLIDEHKQKMKTYTKKKTHKRHPILKTILQIIFWIAVVVGAIIWLMIESFKTAYPQIKDSILNEIDEIQAELSQVDDSELSIDEYYQKQMLLLITSDDVDAMLSDFEDIEQIIAIIQNNGEINVELLPEDKREKYQQLVEEYEKAKANAQNSEDDDSDSYCINDDIEYEAVE